MRAVRRPRIGFEACGEKARENVRNPETVFLLSFDGSDVGERYEEFDRCLVSGYDQFVVWARGLLIRRG